jgi:uncharacterized protein YqfA (UPF0365 family)
LSSIFFSMQSAPRLWTLRHESRQMADRAFDDDVDAFHGNAAARRRIAVDHERAAASGGAGRLRRVAPHPYFSRHHIFGDTLAGIAFDDDGRLFVHAGAVVADVTVDLDKERAVEAGGDRMLPARIEHPPMRLVGVGRQSMQSRVELAHRAPGEVDIWHQCNSHR